MAVDVTRMCELLVGLPDVNVLEVVELDAGLRVTIETRGARPLCGGCGGPVGVKDRDDVEHADLPCFGRPTVLVWRKIRWGCARGCGAGSFTETAAAIAAPRQKLTDRAGRWATVQVGRRGRPVSEVAGELGAGWDPVMDAVATFGQALIDDPDRFGDVEALGMDETLRARTGPWKTQQWSTQIVDVNAGQLLDVVEGRDSTGPCEWLAARPQVWLDGIRWATLDLSGPYRKVFDTMLPEAEQVADPFHVHKLANTRLDECRRRVQNETFGHRGRKDDPLYRARRLLIRLTSVSTTRAAPSSSDSSTPATHEARSWPCGTPNRSSGRSTSTDDPSGRARVRDPPRPRPPRRVMTPPEANLLGRTLLRWRHQIAAWHRARRLQRTNRSVNNLVKRVKRVAFGFRQPPQPGIRALLYAGQPNWDLLPTTEPR